MKGKGRAIAQLRSLNQLRTLHFLIRLLPRLFHFPIGEWSRQFPFDFLNCYEASTEFLSVTLNSRLHVLLGSPNGVCQRV